MILHESGQPKNLLNPYRLTPQHKDSNCSSLAVFKPVPLNKDCLLGGPIPMPILQTRGGPRQAWRLRPAEEPTG